MIQLLSMDNIQSFYWATMPSALKGAARTIDMFGNLDEYKTSSNADRNLIKNDWENVGNDLRISIDTYGKEQTKEKSANKNSKPTT